MFGLIVVQIKYIDGKLVRSWDGLSVVLPTLFMDKLTLSGFKSSTQFSSFHQYSDMLKNQQFRENGRRKEFMSQSMKELLPDPKFYTAN